MSLSSPPVTTTTAGTATEQSGGARAPPTPHTHDDSSETIAAAAAVVSPAWPTPPPRSSRWRSMQRSQLRHSRGERKRDCWSPPLLPANGGNDEGGIGRGSNSWGIRCRRFFPPPPIPPGGLDVHAATHNRGPRVEDVNMRRRNKNIWTHTSWEDSRTTMQERSQIR